MSDCSRNAWAVPKSEEREPNVIYQHPLYSHERYENADAIVVSGVRFERVNGVKRSRTELAEKWHISEDNEWYEAESFDSREAAIEAGRASFGGAAFFVGREMAWWPSVDEDDVITQMAEQAYDYAGEYADDWLRNVTNDDLKELRGAIQRVTDEWLEKTGNVPTFFMVEWTERIEGSEV